MNADLNLDICIHLFSVWGFGRFLFPYSTDRLINEMHDGVNGGNTTINQADEKQFGSLT